MLASPCCPPLHFLFSVTNSFKQVCSFIILYHSKSVKIILWSMKIILDQWRSFLIEWRTFLIKWRTFFIYEEYLLSMNFIYDHWRSFTTEQDHFDHSWSFYHHLLIIHSFYCSWKWKYKYCHPTNRLLQLSFQLSPIFFSVWRL